MPKRVVKERVAAIGDEDRGRLMQLVLRSPKDAVACAFATAAVVAIVVNAMAMQTGRHPAPMFGARGPLPASVAAVVSPLPKPRPAEASLRVTDPKLLDPKPIEIKPAEHKGEPRASEPRATEPRSTVNPAVASVPRPPAPVPQAKSDPLGDLIVQSRRVAGVQRALTEYGYGQLKPTGNVGSETREAIQRFERDRKLPITGQMSERLVRELSAMTGRPIE